MDNVKETAKVLEQALQDQYNANVVANEDERRLAEQKLMYQNEKAGTLYSGIPTWQRANNATQYSKNLANINADYANSRVNLWNSVQNTIDQINAYNDAAKSLGGKALSYNTTVPTVNQYTSPFYMNGKWYTYNNGQLTEVTQ